MKNPLKIISLFLVLGMLWGSAFIGIEVLVREIPPWLAAALRIGFATLFLYAFSLSRRKHPPLSLRLRLKVWAAGLLTIGLPFSFLFWGEKKISGGLAGIINGTVPIWTALIVFAGSRRTQNSMSKMLMLGIVLGFSGLLVIFYPRISIPSAREEFSGALAVVFMALCYAFSNLLNRQMITETKGLRIQDATFHQHLASFVYVLALSLVTESWPSFSDIFLRKEIILTAIYLGIFPSAVAFWIYFYLLKEIGSVQTAAVTYIVPVFALALDYLILGHRPEVSGLVGVALILGGLYFVRSDRPQRQKT